MHMYIYKKKHFGEQKKNKLLLVVGKYKHAWWAQNTKEGRKHVLRVTAKGNEAKGGEEPRISQSSCVSARTLLIGSRLDQ